MSQDNSSLPSALLDSATHIPGTVDPIPVQAATPVREAVPSFGLAEEVITASKPIEGLVKDEVSDGASSLEDGELGSAGPGLRSVSSMGSVLRVLQSTAD